MKTLLDKTIKDIMGINSTYKSTFGVEVEAEGSPRWPGDNSWIATRDGSLRGEALEYVLSSPMDLKDASNEVTRLYQKITTAPNYISDSMRAGVHIHINFLQDTFREVMTFLACYYSIEDCLISKFGAEREGNLFCLRMSDADYVNTIITTVLNNEDPFRYLRGNDNIRYAAMNLSSLGKYGSLEVRALRTPKTPEIIIEVMEILDLIKRNSKKFKSPREVLDFMSADGIYNFVELLLEDKNEFITNQENFEEKIQNNLRNIQFWVYTTDWKV